MLLDWRDYSDASYITYQVFEERNTRFFVKTLQEGDTVIDIGASRGWFSLLSSVLVKSGRVISVEPLSSNILVLTKAIEENKSKNIILEKVAVGDHEGTAELKSLPLNSGSPSIVDFFGADKKTDRTALVSEIVTLTTVDTIVSKHSLTKLKVIKIDVQGAELDVLRGMANTLQAKKCEYVLIEYNQKSGGDEVRRYIETFGYSCYQILGTGSLEPVNEMRDKEDYVYTHLPA
jgi:FkbM family methyltransferase